MGCEDRLTREGPHIEIRSSPGTVEVELPERPSTGYVWKLVDTPETVQVVGREYRDANATTQPLAGGGGLRIFRLEVSEPGRHELEFLLQRPWQEDALERRVVTLIIDSGESD